MRPLLSICVPTFYRANEVYNTVLNHLTFKSREIEVIVSDNGSQDNTVELLSNIKDSRFKLYKNSVNKGFQYNLYNVVRKATGYFVCWMSDQDIFDKKELEQILEWIKSFISDKYCIGAIVPMSASNIVTKREELLNLLYEKMSYMSGIVINRDLLTEEDLEVSIENYYPHVALLLKCASRGRVIFSPYNLIRQYYTKDENIAERVKLEANNKGTCKITPYSAESRCNQLESERHMILDLDVSNETKVYLLSKQYQIKLFQGATQVEVLRRSPECCNYLNINPEEQSSGIEYRISEIYYQTVKEYFGGLGYEGVAKDFIRGCIKDVQNIRRTRNTYDELTLKHNYTVVMAGKESYIMEYVDKLVKYNFRVDYLCISDSNVEGEVVISEEDLITFEKIVLLVDGEDTEYMNKLQRMEFKEAHLFYVQDLDIMI